MLELILSSFYFFLPAYFTNMIPSLLGKRNIFPSLGKPVDFGKKYKNSPLFGDHKTWRGVILGPTVGILIAFLQAWLFKQSSFIQNISLFNYQEVNIFLFGFLISFGTMIGDLASAFIKRRLNLKPGARFMPFDQINYVIGTAFFLTLFSKITIDIKVWITLLILTFLLHISSTQIGFVLGLSKSKW